MKKKAVETVENKKHVSHRFHSTATAAAIYFLMKTTWLFLTKLQKIIDTTPPRTAPDPNRSTCLAYYAWQTSLKESCPRRQYASCIIIAGLHLVSFPFPKFLSPIQFAVFIRMRCTATLFFICSRGNSPAPLTRPF